jgi:pyruvate, orthophosphate dikinase
MPGRGGHPGHGRAFVRTRPLQCPFDEGGRDQKDLAEMTKLGLPVPPGFTITTEACRHFLRHDRLPDELRVQVTMAVRHLEDAVGRRLGDSVDPLLVSVRSGARFSMPGMMETVLNVGLNHFSVPGLVKASGDERFVWDSYRRLISMFGKTVLGVEGEAFVHALDVARGGQGGAGRRRPGRH